MLTSNSEFRRSGMLIINADDWGRDQDTTDRILDCVLHGSVSSTSAMVFMEDSERAADLALNNGVDVGLHLNFTTCFSSSITTGRLAEHSERVARFLRRGRLPQVVYHPGLVDSFEYIVSAQREEFRRIYGVEPRRIDGHHHMHLCANVVFAELLPAGTIVRRNFSFKPAEKSWLNRLYREIIDRQLAKRHCLADFFFSLPPFEPTGRLDRILQLASQSVVEVETHPINRDEYRFLKEGDIFRRTYGVPIASGYKMPKSE